MIKWDGKHQGLPKIFNQFIRSSMVETPKNKDWQLMVSLLGSIAEQKGITYD